MKTIAADLYVSVTVTAPNKLEGTRRYARKRKRTITVNKLSYPRDDSLPSHLPTKSLKDTVKVYGEMHHLESCGHGICRWTRCGVPECHAVIYIVARRSYPPHPPRGLLPALTSHTGTP